MRIMLAPMEGVIDHHFRALYSEIGGIDLCVSEFIRVNDLPVGRNVLQRDCPELTANYRSDVSGRSNLAGHTETATPVRVQLLGSNPETLAETACNAACLGAPGIDLNFGCPAKTVNNSMGGAILLRDTERIHRIVSTVRKAVDQSIPVTAKIRLGYEKRENYVENAIAIAEAGASELCVHARSRADKYDPPAYWPCIAEIKQAVPMPVIANGEIWTVEDWERCREESHCDDFMLGRGLIACPDLALQIKAAYHKGAESSKSRLHWKDIIELLYQFYVETRDSYPPRFLGNRVKQWLFYLKLHYPEATTFFEEIKRFKVADDFERAFWNERAQHQ